MSKYSKVIKLIIFIIVLVSLSAAIVYMESSMDNMNRIMPEISDNIVQGDKEYNEAVDLVNEKYFYDGAEKLNSAEGHYKKSLDLLSKIKNNVTVDVDDVHVQYINLVYAEVEMKLKAVNSFKTAIEYFKIEENATGTSYAGEANEYIYEAIGFQNSRDALVKNNSNLFKENYIF